MKYIWVMVFLLLPSCVFGSDIYTAGELGHDCQELTNLTSNRADSTNPNYLAAGRCDGFMLGWMMGLTESYVATAVPGKMGRIHFDENLSMAQVGRVFVKYMQQHPELEHKIATQCLGEALMEAGLMHVELVNRPLDAKNDK